MLVGALTSSRARARCQRASSTDEEIVVTGHRDGGAYDRAVADTLSGLGLSPVLRPGGPGPALLADVAGGNALALSTAACAVDPNITTRTLDPPVPVGFQLLWQAADAAPGRWPS